MSTLLQSLDLAPPAKGKPRLAGLVSVKDNSFPPTSIAEEVARQEARLLEGNGENTNILVDYIFFRRFTDERSSQPAAYVLDNSGSSYTRDKIAELHHRVWLNGKVPLLYVEWPTCVDVLRCAAEPDFWDKNERSLKYNPLATIAEVSQALDRAKTERFSAYRLSDGTFWESPENEDWACADKAAHKLLIQAVKEADNELDGTNNKLMRRLLLLFIFSKYLEDRGVFPNHWFGEFCKETNTFQDVLKHGEVDEVIQMFNALRTQFNGDIFEIEDIGKNLTRSTLSEFYKFIEGKTLRRQMYLWKQYSFNYIPVEVLSHLYQHFAQEGNGAVFTPPLVVDLMLDHAMPYEKITGDETIFDPTCGSGIFLVGAFRRIVHHWKSQNEWKRPDVGWLKEKIKKSIFGAELTEDAAHVAAFNLALAVCDALLPEIIWKDLRFNKIIGTNIFIGDVFENIEKIRAMAGNGFSLVLGNPPFKSALTDAARKTRHSENTIPIPDNQLSYRVIEESVSLLAPNGKMCLIQPHGFLYNANARIFLTDWISKNTVETVLDFVSIRNLFESADAKAVAILATRGNPKENHEITHLTFRRTKSLHERVAFELDHYDWHQIPQKQAEKFPLVWKANLLGGGRLASLSEEFSTSTNFQTLKDFWDDQGWTHGEGFIVGKQPEDGKPDKRKLAKWLTGRPFLPTEAFTKDGINKNVIGRVTETKFKHRATEARFTPPMVLIKENETLPTIFWAEDKGYITFKDKIISINTSANNSDKLQQFAKSFEKIKQMLRAVCFLTSSQVLVGKSTAILKHDLEELPWPKDGQVKKLSFWEKALLDDVLDCMAELVQIGQNSNVFAQTATKKTLAEYASLFVKMLGSVYRNLNAGPSGVTNNLAYQAFYFGEESKIEWPDDWDEKINSIIYKDNGSFRTNRILHHFEKDKLIIIKPNLLRHWIQSTAIWDADEVLAHLHKNGF